MEDLSSVKEQTLTQTERQVIWQLRHLDFGNVVVTVKNNVPVALKQEKTIRLD